MPRLFVALELPESVKEALDPMMSGLGDVRWASPDQQHLTLRFIGDVDDRTANDISEGLASFPGHPFEVTLKGIGHFPPRGQPRVLWVGVERNRELTALKRRMDRALAELGVPPESRKYSPHVTLARVRGPLSPTRLGGYLIRHNLFKSAPFPVHSFHLFSSWLRPEGAHYQLEASYELVPGSVDID